MKRGENFTMFSNAVMRDTSLTIGARLTHAMFTHLAWKAGRESEVEAVVLPSLEEIAREIGCSKTALLAYTKELRDTGLVAAARVKGSSTSYVVYTSRPKDDAEFQARKEAAARRSGGVDSGPAAVWNPDREGAALPLRVKDPSQDVGAKAPTPGVTLVDRQNLPMNALAEACGKRIDGSGASALAAALNGRGGRKGIRDFFWLELTEWAERNSALAQLEEARGERFEIALAKVISERAAMYRDKMPAGAMLTPSALLSHWSDLDAMPARSGRGGGMSADDIARFGS